MSTPTFFPPLRQQEPAGIVAEFTQEKPLLDAVRALRAAGYTQIETFTPFPIHGMDKAMGLKPSRLSFVVFFMGLMGTASAFAMQYWMNAVDYQLRVGGKPIFSYQSYVPIMFELTVLFGGITALVGMLAFNRLPQPYHPLLTHGRFLRATDDTFFIAVASTDPKWNTGHLQQLLATLGGTHLTTIHAEGEIL